MDNNYGENEGKKMIDTIMASQRQEELSNINVSGMINKAFGGLKRKQRHVLKRRFGLVGTEKKTLQEIGDSYGVTRERIRQIEKAALKRLSKEINFKYFSPVTSAVMMELEQSGGIMSENSLINKVLRDSNNEYDANGLRLIFEVHPEMIIVKENDYQNESWKLENIDDENIVKLIEAVNDYLKAENEVKEINHIHENVGAKHNIDQKLLESVLDLAKTVMRTPDGKYGLVNWSFINPKNIRDKVYYVLKKNKKPMHFMDITDLIIKEDFLHKKRITHQAVHNELIADDRYVLIGKGIYALKEWGYKPGTVAEVIKSILIKNNKPMSRDEIINEVMKERVVKKNTIVINLHNKDMFERNKDGLFTVKR